MEKNLKRMYMCIMPSKNLATDKNWGRWLEKDGEWGPERLNFWANVSAIRLAYISLVIRKRQLKEKKIG